MYVVNRTANNSHGQVIKEMDSHLSEQGLVPTETAGKASS